jgi:cbb3-type cytochrome oxidase maturation protein
MKPRPTLQPISNNFLRMEIIFILILISLVLAVGFLAAYFWATKNGQFDDDCTPAIRMLFDDELKPGREDMDNKTKKLPEELAKAPANN